MEDRVTKRIEALEGWRSEMADQVGQLKGTVRLLVAFQASSLIGIVGIIVKLFAGG